MLAAAAISRYVDWLAKGGVHHDAHIGKEAGKPFEVAAKSGIHRDSQGRFARSGHAAKLGSRTHQTPTRIHGADHAEWLKHQAGERREHAADLRGERRALRREQRGERRTLDRDHSRQSASLDRRQSRESAKLETRHAREAAGSKNPAATAQRHSDERAELSSTHHNERGDLRREHTTERRNLHDEHREARQDQRAGHQESIAELRRTQRETMTEALREIRDGRRAARDDREASGGKSFGFKANNGGAQSGPVVNPQLTTPEVDEFRGRYPDASPSDVPLAGSLLRLITGQLAEWERDASDDYAKVQAIKASDETPPPIVQMRGDGFDVVDGWHRLAAFVELGRQSILGYVLDGSGRPIRLTSREAKSWGGASISAKDLPDRGIGPEGGDEPENTYGLPDGDDIAERLRHFFGIQATKVLGVIPNIGQPLPDDFHLPDLAEYDEPMTEAFTPLVSAYWDQAGQAIREKIGLEPDAWPDSWNVKDPHLEEKIRSATFNFCASTNATTSKTLADALLTLRGELIEGIVTHGESVETLTDRVQGVFENAERFRARRIAATEASRAVHAAGYESVKESDVVQGIEWLLSSNACPLCHKIKNEVGQVRLGDNFAVIGNHPNYSDIKFPPAHPTCRCSYTSILSADMGGPEKVDWGDALIQPQEDVAPETIVKRAQREIGREEKRQRSVNAEEAKRNPVVTQDIVTRDIKLARSGLEREQKQLAELTKDYYDNKDKWPDVKAKREAIIEKMYDYSLSKQTRRKWEKRLEEFQPEYDKMKGTVDYFPSRKKYHDEMIEHYQQSLDKALADPKAKRSYPYADLQSKHQNLIAPGPIQDRIKAYSLGDTKVKAIQDLSTHYDKQEAKLAARRTAIDKQVRDLMYRQADLVEKYAAESLDIPHEIQLKVDALQKQIDDAINKKKPIVEQQKSLTDRKREDLVSIIATKDGVEFKSKDVPTGYSTDGHPLVPMTADTQRSADKAKGWLKRVTTKADVTEIETKIGEGPGLRAHFSQYDDHIQLMTGQHPDVIVHEYGHGIEYRLKTGDDAVVKRSMEFLNHRVGDEVPVDIKQKFGCGDAGEMGRKDKFDRVFSDHSAHYVGKVYYDATEIVSMGLQQLYNDPVVFATKDPEYCKFILGILDGSLR